jgi:hypothetical protein
LDVHPGPDYRGQRAPKANGALIRAVDNWRMGGQENDIIQSGLASTNDAESALIETLTGNRAYTALVRGVITQPASLLSRFTAFSNRHRRNHLPDKLLCRNWVASYRKSCDQFHGH